MRNIYAPLLTLAVAALGGLTTVALSQPKVNPVAKPRPAEQWDWTGIIGTGQSLSVGARAMPVKSTVQPYGNLKLFTDKLAWPVDPNADSLKMVPLVEPIGRLSPNYPSSWPENIDGETPHTSAANQISSMCLAELGHDMVTVHSAVGEDGQGMVFLKKNAEQKGLNGHSFQAALIETKAIARLAKAAGKTYGVGAIFITHGETDCGNTAYEDQLYRLWIDDNTDLRAITGQTRPVLMIASQQNSLNDYSPSTIAQWKAGFDYADAIVCSGPKYQYPYVADAVHLTADGYRLMGEKYGEVFYHRFVLGDNWQPLEPIGVTRNGASLTIRFHVPNQPMVWESTFDTPHASMPEWKNGKGFEVSSATGAKVTIDSADFSSAGDEVILKCAADPGPNARVSYALVGEQTARTMPVPGTKRWGLLRDSDPTVGAGSKQNQPNYCVAFELTAP